MSKSKPIKDITIRCNSIKDISKKGSDIEVTLTDIDLDEFLNSDIFNKIELSKLLEQFTDEEILENIRVDSILDFVTNYLSNDEIIDILGESEIRSLLRNKNLDKIL